MDFDAEVRGLVGQVPGGMVSTFGGVAEALGDAVASGAVGRWARDALGRVDGLHRLVYADGRLWMAEKSRQARMLELEGVHVRNGRVEDLDRVTFQDFGGERPLEGLRRRQLDAAARVITDDTLERVETVGGIDVSYDGDRAFVACVVLELATGEELMRNARRAVARFPYIPTYLTFRELPLMKDVIEPMNERPDVLMIDGNGVLHPHGIGLASHLGVVLDSPTIGVAKSLLCGSVGSSGGHASRVTLKGRQVGWAFRATGRVKRPVYVSPGHRISMDTALEVTRKLSMHRVPEPIRLAHQLATAERDMSKFNK